MPGIGDLLLSLRGVKSPQQALINEVINGGSPGAAAPTAAPTSGAQNDVPDALKTTDDLASLYNQALNRDARSRRIDSGLALIAAGLDGASVAQAAPLLQQTGSPSVPDFDTLLKLRQQREVLAARERQRAALPTLAGKLGISEDVLAAYHEAGALDDVLKENAKVPADVASYNFYAQQQQASGKEPMPFTEWLKDTRRAGASRVTVNAAGETDKLWGDAPKDMIWARDPKTGEVITQRDPKTGGVIPIALPVKGGSVDLEADALKRKHKTKRDQAIVNAESVIGEINLGMRIVEQFPATSTGLGSTLQAVPGTYARQLNEITKSVGSNVSIDKLQQMREANETGGALGQVPVRQQQLLMSMLGSLETEQRPEFLMNTFKRISNVYNDIIFGRGNWEGKYGIRYDLPFDANARKFAEGYDYKYITKGELTSLSPEEREAFISNLDESQLEVMLQRLRSGE